MRRVNFSVRERNRKSFIVLGAVVVAATVFWHLYEMGFNISLETFEPCGYGAILVVMGLAFIVYGVSSKDPVDYTQTLKEINKNLVKLQNPEDREETLEEKINRRRAERSLKDHAGNDYEQLVNKYKPKQPGDDFI